MKKPEFTEQDVVDAFVFVEGGLNGSNMKYPPHSKELLKIVLNKIRKRNKKLCQRCS